MGKLKGKVMNGRETRKETRKEGRKIWIVGGWSGIEWWDGWMDGWDWMGWIDGVGLNDEMDGWIGLNEMKLESDGGFAVWMSHWLTDGWHMKYY